MKAIVLEKGDGRAKITRVIKNGILVTKRNGKVMDTYDVKGREEATAQSLISKGYKVIKHNKNDVDDPVMQGSLF
ncbi:MULTISPECIES: hypothetical protein [unclassified Breznakia]|uniref:hypothetical protein n=1 Tax=unclassified Breznakia TaxID=2623764 RepID=UPI002474BB32|nr:MULTISPECIES: hypothetical protein [unclassified Breznakia]MDH6367539.1 putative lipoprotein YajG [Breznakia sp. PH1-1]MDH6404667.1 putative lipoprotein YajG [Breznakia sp. PF1-11]MDH6412369.1 putative lipoprotein YajG [Breznakia sp. PFB1-11]MDH6414707.1 putative lipoprotein YajG [Breznakia sp. PFB1-14]MDH6417048.1 putative lipoprotein YajG [Breznakia sp. PFB1-4]